MPSQINAVFPARGWRRSITGLGPIFEQYDDEKPHLWTGVRDQVVALLKQDMAYHLYVEFNNPGPQGMFREFHDAVEEIETALSPDDFDDALDTLYDWGDDHRVWIDPYKAKEDAA